MTLLLIGLGNPGLKYQNTRHNAGFHVVDKLAKEFGVKFKKAFFKPYQFCKINIEKDKLILIKPTTYMNRSGEVIPDILSKYKLTNNNVVVITDNLDIKKGLLKFKLKGSDGGHNGLKSIFEYIGTYDFKRLFIGIDRPEKGKSVAEYVLSDITDELVIKAEERAIQGLLQLLKTDVNQVINFINRRKID